MSHLFRHASPIFWRRPGLNDSSFSHHDSECVAWGLNMARAQRWTYGRRNGFGPTPKLPALEPTNYAGLDSWEALSGGTSLTLSESSTAWAGYVVLPCTGIWYCHTWAPPSPSGTPGVPSTWAFSVKQNCRIIHVACSNHFLRPD